MSLWNDVVSFKRVYLNYTERRLHLVPLFVTAVHSRGVLIVRKKMSEVIGHLDEDVVNV